MTVNFIHLNIFFYMKILITDDEQDDEETEEDSEGIEECVEEEEDDDEVIITSATNLSQNFETSLDNSSILLNSTFTSDDDPVASFCNDRNPTAEKFQLILDEDKFKAFKDFLSNASEEDYLTHLVYTILKLSSIGEQSSGAQKLALELFQEAFEYAKTKDRVSYFVITKL